MAPPTENPAEAVETLTHRPAEATDALQALAVAQYIKTRLEAVQHSVDERVATVERQQQRSVNMLLYGVVIGFALAIVLLAVAFALQQM